MVSDRLKDYLASAFGFIRAKKEIYDTGSRFLKMRVWIVGVLSLDVVLTLGFVLFSGGRALDVIVWYEPGFPANMLVVKNEGDPLVDATLILDDAYQAQVEKIDRGLNGYEVNHVFHDTQDFAPPDSYRPQRLEIRVKRDKVMVPIGTKAGGGS